MDEVEGREPVVPGWDVFALAACEALRGEAGFHVAPQVPMGVAHGAMGCYLPLGPREVILAVYDPTAGASPSGGCAVTNRRVAWFDRSAADDPAFAAPGDGGDVDPAFVPVLIRLCVRSLGLGELPEPVAVRAGRTPSLDMGHGLALTPRGLDRAGAASLAGVLSVLGRAARTGDLTGVVPPAALGKARAGLDETVNRTELIRATPAAARSFDAHARAATPRVVVTPAVVAACALVYAAMVLSGVSPTSPGAATLYAWGGSAGFALAAGGQPWRLLTTVFLHGGLVHLGFNMWCLSRSGPLIERLYGNTGFALLYLISGLGGSLASAWWHPLVVGVGASGAIFGVIGGLLAFLLVHRAAIPPSVLTPLRSSVFAFVAYNGLFGLATPGIDNAAHLGGLATGFFAGLMLSRPWAVTHPTQGLARQIAAGVLMAVALVPVGLGVSARIGRDPEVVAARRDARDPAEAFNGLMAALRPYLDGYDSATARLDELLRVLEKTPTEDARPRRDLDRLVADVKANRAGLEAVPVGDPELVAVRQCLVDTYASLEEGIRALRRYLDRPDDRSLIDGPEGFRACHDRTAKAVERYTALRDSYVARHGLIEAPAPGPGGPP